MKRLILLILILPLFSWSQSHLINVGESAVYFSNSFSINRLGNGYGVELAFSGSGTNDIGFAYIKNTLNTGFKKDWDFYIPFIRFHSGKENKNRILSSYISLAYIMVGSEYDISGFEISLGVYKKIKYDNFFEILPHASGAFSILSASLNEGTDQKVVQTGASIGITEIFNFNSNVFELDQTFSFSQQAVSYAVGIGYLYKF